MTLLALLGILGALALVLSIAARFFLPDLLAPALAHWIEGFGVGLIAAALADWLARALARPGTAGGRLSLFAAAGSTCPTCRRPLLPGVLRCPFCNPVVPSGTPLEGTLGSEYKPLEEPVPMPGLAAAAKLRQEAGAAGYLHVFEGDNKGESILLGKGVVGIGRAPQNTLILKDTAVSQRHAEIRPRDGGYVLIDLGSKNGTFLNDQRVSEAKLASGDVIAFGSTKILVHLAE